MKTRGQIRDKLFGVGRIAPTEHHAGNELRVCVDGDPQPNVASARYLIGDLRGDVLLLAVVESPQLVHLDPPRRASSERRGSDTRRRPPRSYQQLETAFLDAPVMRTVERIEQPSIRQFRMAARVLGVQAIHGKAILLKPL